MVLLADPEAGHPNLAHAPGQDAVEVQDQRGLAGAVGPEQRDPLALGDRQVDAKQGLVAIGVGEGQAGHLQGRGLGHEAIQAALAVMSAAKGSTAAVAQADAVAGRASISGSDPV